MITATIAGPQTAFLFLVLAGLIVLWFIGAYFMNRRTARLEAKRNKDSVFNYEKQQEHEEPTQYTQAWYAKRKKRWRMRRESRRKNWGV